MGTCAQMLALVTPMNIKMYQWISGLYCLVCDTPIQQWVVINASVGLVQLEETSNTIIYILLIM